MIRFTERRDFELLVGSSDGRTGYLRDLFIGELTRDMEALRSLAQ